MTSIGFIDILIIVLIGVIEGITEWLPVSSTGHMLIFDEFIPFNASEAFKEMFFVVIQLGAILAVVTVFFKKMLPVSVETVIKTSENGDKDSKKLKLDKGILMLWAKVAVACLPSAIIGLFLDDFLEEHFGSSLTVSIMLIAYGIAFIIIEKLRDKRAPKLNSLQSITFSQAFIIGCFQVLSLIPGTSRSGATIIGALIIGVARPVAAEFTFFLAVPTMLGASALKLIKFGFNFTGAEIIAVIVGMAVAYIVSLAAIKFLMDFVKKHSFTVFGCYRIVLGAIILTLALI